MFDIPVSLKAVQIARHMMGFDPLWTEGILTMQQRVAHLIAERDDCYGNWIPVAIHNRPGFMRVEENGLSGEYRSSVEPAAQVLDIQPIRISPTEPVTLRQMLRHQLAAWPAGEQQPLFEVISRLSDPAFTPLHPALRDTLLWLFEHPHHSLSALKPQVEVLLAQCSPAFSQLALCGREMAVVLAFATLTNAVIDHAHASDRTTEATEAAPEGPPSESEMEDRLILVRAILPSADLPSEAMLEALLCSMARAGRAPTIAACVEQFEVYVNDAFEAAKAVGVNDEVNEEEAAERVCNDFGYALTLWSDMHHALRMLLPIAYAGQVLARFLLDHVNLPEAKKEKIAFAYKQFDETVVIIMTSLSHAVRMHDPAMRAAKIELIRQAREKKGDREARAVMRNLIEQQAFYPRAWKQWLDQASREIRNGEMVKNNPRLAEAIAGIISYN